MKKSFLILICCLIFLTAVPLFSLAAVGPFVSDLAPVSSFVDLFEINHDYLALYSSDLTSGVLIEVVYPSLTVPLSISIASDDCYFYFSNISDVDYTCYINVRNLATGLIYYSEECTVLASATLTTSYSVPVLEEGATNYSPDYSILDTVVFFGDYQFTLEYLNNRFTVGSIEFSAQFSEDGYILSPLVEPAADLNNRFCVIANDNMAYLVSVSFSAISGTFTEDLVTCELSISSSGDYLISYFNHSDKMIYAQISLYDVSNGFYVSSSTRALLGNYSGRVTFSTYTPLEFPSCQTFGMSFVNSYAYNTNLPKILWNYDRLNAEGIAAQTTILLNQLYIINRNISNIYDFLVTELPSIEAWLRKLYDLFEDVYKSEGETYTDPPTQALDDYLADESAVYDVLPSNMVDNIDSAFGQANVDFSGNGAFGLIRSLMQSLVFDDSRLSGFVFFALAIGIAVLILGRKINA